MNEPPIDSATPPAPDFKDRRTGLKVFGIVEVLLGGLAALMIPLMLFGQIMAARVGQDAMPLRHLIPGLVFYLMVAVVFVWVGIGSFLARRWGRALSLIISWSWLITGLMTLVFMVFFLPAMLKASQQQGQAMPEGVQIIIQVVVLVGLGIFFVVVPAVFVWFYQGRHVKATCEAHDPVSRWTDACPLPVLGLCLWLGLGAFSLLLMPVWANGVLPVFGRLISGPLGSIGCVALAGVLGYVAWAMYRLQHVGWWVALLFMCLAAASAFVTFSQVDLIELYRLMGYPERQIEMMKHYPFMQGNRMAYLSCLGTVPMLGYLVFIRRYFR